MAEPYFTLRKQYFTARKRNFTARVSALPRQFLLHQFAHKLHALVYVLKRRAGEVQPERALVSFWMRIEVYARYIGYLLFVLPAKLVVRCFEVRSRHSVGAVAGGRTGLTYTPSSNSFLLISSVRSAS